MRIEEVGLTMRLPLGTAVQRDRMGTVAVNTVVPEDQSWRVKVETHLTSNRALSLMEIADASLATLQKSVGERFIPKSDLKNPDANPKWVGSRAGWVERIPNDKQPKLVILNGATEVPIERFYVALPRGQETTPVVRGFTVVQVASQQFVSFDLLTTIDKFDAVRPVYEAMVATVRFGNPEEITAQRGAAIDAGLEVVRSLSTEDFAAVLGGAEGREKWIRMFRPAPTGARSDAEEVGYTRIKTRIGQRGLIDPTRPKSRWLQSDRQEGYIVDIDARFLSNGMVVDSKAVYFMSPDREQEAWTVRNAFRDLAEGGSNTAAKPPQERKKAAAKMPTVATEVGARSGNSMQVTISATGRGDEVIKPTLQSEAYISRVEALLMPQLLVRQKRTMEYGFYNWHGPESKIKLRRDTVDQPIDRPGVWQVTTRIGDDDRTQVAIYNEAGELIRTVMPDGVVCEPSGAQEIAKLWESKNLPVGKID